METVVYPNGVKLTWDNTIQVGQLITTYNIGYHVLERIEYRGDETPLFHYVRVDGRNRYKNSCDASYCVRVTIEMVEREHQDSVNAANRLAETLLSYLGKAPLPTGK
jgi:hypothetical protein